MLFIAVGTLNEACIVAQAKALEQVLDCCLVYFTHEPQDLIDGSSFTRLSIYGYCSEDQLVLGESTCLIRQDVIDLSELLRQLH